MGEQWLGVGEPRTLGVAGWQQCGGEVAVVGCGGARPRCGWKAPLRWGSSSRFIIGRDQRVSRVNFCDTSREGTRKVQSDHNTTPVPKFCIAAPKFGKAVPPVTK